MVVSFLIIQIGNGFCKIDCSVCKWCNNRNDALFSLNIQYDKDQCGKQQNIPSITQSWLRNDKSHRRLVDYFSLLPFGKPINIFVLRQVRKYIFGISIIIVFQQMIVRKNSRLGMQIKISVSVRNFDKVY